MSADPQTSKDSLVAAEDVKVDTHQGKRGWLKVVKEVLECKYGQTVPIRGT